MNKYLPVLLALLSLHNPAQAQIRKGTVLLGGSVQATTFRFTDNSNADNKSRGLSLAPAAGLFIGDNLAVGVDLAYGGQSSKAAGNSTEEKNRHAGLGLFARRYLTLGKNFYLFGEAGAGYGSSWLKRLQNGNELPQKDVTNSWTLNLYPGVTYAATRRLLLEASLAGIAQAQYSTRTISNSATPATDSKSRQFNLAANASGSVPLNLGFRFMLGAR